MKKLFLLFVLLSGFTTSLICQTPAGFHYQAVVRDASNAPYQNRQIAFKISIVEDDGSDLGIVVYSERQESTTTNLGLISLNVGMGNPLQDNFNSINWSTGVYSMQIEMDVDAGTNYVLMGKSQLLATPYALHAQTVENSDDADADPTNEMQSLDFDPNTNQLSISNGNSIIIPTGGTDADADPANELQSLSFDANTNQLSISRGNSITIPTGGTDGDADPVNELQTLSKDGLNISLSQNGGTFSVADNDNDAKNELQSISKSGNNITLSNGGGSFTDEVEDADADAENELQIISKNGNIVTLSNGGGSFSDEVNDADADPQNEIQSLSFDKVNNMLILSGGGSVDLSSLEDGGVTGDDDQTLSISGTQLSIESGNSIDLSVLQDGVDDADADPQNEIQSLSFDKANNTLNLSGGGSVDLSSLEDGGVTGDDDQTLSISGTQLSIESGNSIDLSVLQDGVDDADADPQNEIQTISKNGEIVSLSEGGGSFSDAVDDADADPQNEIQTISKNGGVVSLSSGGGSFTDAVDDADADPQNELQNLTLNGNMLEISSGNSLSLANFSTPWESFENGISYDAGEIITNIIETNEIISFGANSIAKFRAKGLEFRGAIYDDHDASTLSKTKMEFSTSFNFSTFGAEQLSFVGEGKAGLTDKELVFNDLQGVESDYGAGILNLKNTNSNKSIELDVNNGYIMENNNSTFSINYFNVFYHSKANGDVVAFGPSSVSLSNNSNVLLPASSLSRQNLEFSEASIDKSSVFDINGVLINNPLAEVRLDPSFLQYRNKTVGLGMKLSPNRLNFYDQNNENENKAILSAQGSGELNLYNNSNNLNSRLGSNNSNTGFFTLYANNGNSSISLTSLGSNDSDHGYIRVKADNQDKALLYAHSSGYGRLQLKGNNTKNNIVLGTIADSNSGFVGVYSEAGTEKASIYSSPSDAGVLRTIGSNGTSNIQLTVLNGNTSNGFIGVYDANGSIRTRMYVNANGQGVLSADVKNFTMPHPQRNNKEIWYASLEGPEAAAYERGTAKLSNGESFVEFSEHFKLVGNSSTMTVILTPLSADTYGLAVIEKLATGFRVKELARGTGDFEFDWEVKCVRKGYEKYKVIRDKKEAQPANDIR